MIYRIRTKWQSRRGASILMVLLLFLLCSMAASAILAAASAVPGRLAGRAEADGPYYKVLSAARLFAGEIDGQKIQFHMKRERTRTDDSEDWGTPSYSDLTYSDGSTSGWTPIPASSPAPLSHTILEDAAYWMVGKAIKEGDPDEQDDAWEGRFGTALTYGYKNFEVEMTGEAGMKVYGRLAVRGNASGTGKLRDLTLAAVFSDSVGSPGGTPGTPFVSSGGGYVLSDGAYHVWLSCEGTVTVEDPPRTPSGITNNDTSETLERTITITWGTPKIVDEIG